MVVQDQKTKMSLIKNQQPDTDKIFLYATNSLKLKYQFLISGREKIENKSIHWLFTSNWWYFGNLEDYNPTEKKKFIVFDDVIADMEVNKETNMIWKLITELFLRGRKLNILLAFFRNLQK